MTQFSEEMTSSNRFIEEELDKKLTSIGDLMSANVISIIAPMHQPVDDWVRDHIEGIENRKESLLVLLETPGGSIETVERIADVLRHHYPKEICFLVPNYAMSAGTVLVMSGDKIFMDYYSVLGPIDPQVRSRSKGDVYVPALGYLHKYSEFIEKAAGNLTSLEIAFFVQKFDPAELHQFEQARDLSIDLLKKWLVKYKFKNWSCTETRGAPVTIQDKEGRAAEIATKLNDTKLWKSHARGLGREVIREELKLIVEDFGANQVLNQAVRAYYRLLQDFMMRLSHSLVIHTQGMYRGHGG
jgi:hypothetical protein